MEVRDPVGMRVFCFVALDYRLTFTRFLPGYYHELFLKGRPGLSVNMKRTKVKGKAKVRRDPDAEPK
jgi:hypothetical protein